MIQDVDPNLVSNLGLTGFNMFLPSTYLPKPDKSDYEYGFITRYFVSKRNQQQIIETSAKDYNVVNEAYFLKTKLDWQISGRKNNLYEGKMLVDSGVQENNILQVNLAKPKMPGIETVLNNPIQFWQGY